MDGEAGLIPAFLFYAVQLGNTVMPMLFWVLTKESKCGIIKTMKGGSQSEETD